MDCPHDPNCHALGDACITLIRTSLPGFKGEAQLWRVDDEYIVTSCSTVFGLETYAFKADEHGNITDWMELPGSRKGTSDHVAVITAYAERKANDPR